MRQLLRVMCGLGLGVATAAPAAGQVVHAVSFGAGLFTPRSYDTRVAGDVWVANLTQPDVLPGVSGSLEFDIKSFRTALLFGEWQMGLGRHVEVSAGLGYHNKRVPSRYRDLVNSERNFTDITQDLRLRSVPVTILARVLPFGDATGVQPYGGIGVVAVRFRYSEVGDFVDPTDFAIFSARYVATGTAVGPVLAGGVRFPLGGDIYALSIEGRYQFVSGRTGGAQAEFLGDRLDLSGGIVNFGFLVRF